MDIFGTIVTAGELILRFLQACAAYSNEAKSLKARFDWDLRVLEAINDYMNQRRDQGANTHLDANNAALLGRTAEYLNHLAAKVVPSLEKIQSRGLLRSAINRALWINRQRELKELEMEIYEWTRRFDIRILSIPSELRTIIPSTSVGDGPNPPAVVSSHDRLEKFVALASKAKEPRAKEMLLKDPKELSSFITSLGDISFFPVTYNDEELVFASRQVSAETIPGTPFFDALESDMGELAGALNCLDPAADVRLLKVEYYFYHKDTTQFLFAQKTPYPTSSMQTLEEMIRGDPFPKTSVPLNTRLRVAHKLAEALFFLHTAGFLHKNVTSSSVVVFERSDRPDAEAPDPMGDTYLMGFDLVRGNESRTTGQGAREAGDRPRPIWEFDAFQHQDRLQGEKSSRYIKTYDVYSLGVVLLEIGFWAPLREVAEELASTEPSGWAEVLQNKSPGMSARTGERYQAIVAWCLGLAGDRIVKDLEFMRHVLDPLEDIVNTLS